MMEAVSVKKGTSPLILAQPHSGTWLPDEVRCMLNEEGSQLRDTDWHIPELYEGLAPQASVVRANFSRYLIDVNRPPDGESLYPDQNSTGLVPLTTFDGMPIWLNEPDELEIVQRIERFHRPYHAALVEETKRAQGEHGFAVLYDCHSIRSTIPYLFDGQLPDLNIGTFASVSCARAIERAVAETCSASPDYTSVLNGRFKGGWTTRQYGRPDTGVHAIQMEIAQCAYLESEVPPFAMSTKKSHQLRELLSRVFDAIQETLGDLK